MILLLFLNINERRINRTYMIMNGVSKIQYERSEKEVEITHIMTYRENELETTNTKEMKF